MESLNYIGEHLGPRNIGKFVLFLSFITSLLAAYGFFTDSNNPYYNKQANNIPFYYRMEIRKGSQVDTLNPIYVLRDSSAFQFADYSSTMGIY